MRRFPIGPLGPLWTIRIVANEDVVSVVEHLGTREQAARNAMKETDLPAPCRAMLRALAGLNFAPDGDDVVIEMKTVPGVG